MDDEHFPRRTQRSQMDLSAPPFDRIGDQNPTDEDRSLTLEALLSTRQHLLVFYTGRSAKNNDAIAPASPIAELIDTIDQYFTATEQLTTQHPLQPFSPANFESTSPFSFDPEQCAAAKRLLRPQERQPPFVANCGNDDNATDRPSSGEDKPPSGTESVLTLDDLDAVFTHPAKYFVRDVMRLSLPNEAVSTKQREAITPEGLQQWQLLVRLLGGDAELHDLLLPALPDRYGGVIKPEFSQLQARGEVPLGTPGEVAFRSRRDTTHLLSRHLRGMPNRDSQSTPENAPSTVFGHSNDDGLRIADALSLPRKDGLAFAFVGRAKAQKLVVPWIRYLAWQITDPAVACHADLFFCDAGSNSTAPITSWRFCAGENPIKRREFACRHFDNLLSLAQDARHTLLPIHPGSSLAFTQELAKQTDCAQRLWRHFWECASDAGDTARLSPKELAQMNKAIAAGKKQWRAEMSGEFTPDPFDTMAYGDTPPFELTAAPGQQLRDGQQQEPSPVAKQLIAAGINPNFVRCALGLWLPLCAAATQPPLVLARKSPTGRTT